MLEYFFLVPMVTTWLLGGISLVLACDQVESSQVFATMWLVGRSSWYRLCLSEKEKKNHKGLDLSVQVPFNTMCLSFSKPFLCIYWTVKGHLWGAEM